MSGKQKGSVRSRGREVLNGMYARIMAVVLGVIVLLTFTMSALSYYSLREHSLYPYLQDSRLPCNPTYKAD